MAAIGDSITLGIGRMQKEFEIVGAVNSAGLDIATQAFGIRNQYMDLSISSVFMRDRGSPVLLSKLLNSGR